MLSRTFVIIREKNDMVRYILWAPKREYPHLGKKVKAENLTPKS